MMSSAVIAEYVHHKHDFYYPPPMWLTEFLQQYVYDSIALSQND